VAPTRRGGGGGGGRLQFVHQYQKYAFLQTQTQAAEMWEHAAKQGGRKQSRVREGQEAVPRARLHPALLDALA